MTVGASYGDMRAGQRKVGDIVIECGRNPRLGCVAFCTFGRKSRRGMIRVRRIDVVCVMTGFAR